VTITRTAGRHGALAGAALPLVRDLLTVAGIPLALAAATWLLVRRHARLGAVQRAGSPD
jgi:hypothetical protein